MVKGILFLILLNLFLIRCQEEDKPKDDLNIDHEDEMEELPIQFNSTVFHLTNTSFRYAYETGENMIIFVYSPKSKRSHRDAPFYDKISQKISELKMPLKVCVLDGNTQSGASIFMGVYNYPEIIIYKRGEIEIYSEKKEERLLMNKLKKEFLGPLIVAKTVSEVKDFILLNPLVMLCTVDPKSDDPIKKKEYKNFKKFAYDMRYHHNIYLNCYSEECLKEYPFRLIYFRTDETPFYLDEDAPLNEVKLSFIDKYYSRKVGGEITMEESNTVFNEKKKILFFIRNPKDETHKEIEKIVYEFCKTKRETAVSYFVDRTKDYINEETASYFGVGEEDEPSIVFVSVRNEMEKEVYKYKSNKIEDFTLKKINQWMEDCTTRKIKPDPKSEAVPKTHPEGIRKVVRRTWEKEVINNDKNIVLRIVDNASPGIRGIHQVAWNNLVKLLPKEEKEKNKIEFVELDSGKNEIEGLPYQDAAIYFYKNGKKDQPIKFKLSNPKTILPTPYEVADWITDLMGIPKVQRIPEPPMPKVFEEHDNHNMVVMDLGEIGPDDKIEFIKNEDEKKDEGKKDL